MSFFRFFGLRSSFMTSRRSLVTSKTINGKRREFPKPQICMLDIPIFRGLAVKKYTTMKVLEGWDQLFFFMYQSPIFSVRISVYVILNAMRLSKTYISPKSRYIILEKLFPLLLNAPEQLPDNYCILNTTSYYDILDTGSMQLILVICATSAKPRLFRSSFIYFTRRSRVVKWEWKSAVRNELHRLHCDTHARKYQSKK